MLSWKLWHYLITYPNNAVSHLVWYIEEFKIHWVVVLISVSHYTNWFGIIQFAGLLFAPFVGFVMDWKPKSKRNMVTDLGYVAAFTLILVIACIFNVLVLVPSLPIQVKKRRVPNVLANFLFLLHNVLWCWKAYLKLLDVSLFWNITLTMLRWACRDFIGNDLMFFCLVCVICRLCGVASLHLRFVCCFPGTQVCLFYAFY